MNFQEAKEYCNERYNGYVASIANEEEQIAVEQYLRKRENKFHWIDFWLGGVKNNSDTFEWVDGTPFKYANWNFEPEPIWNISCIRLDYDIKNNLHHGVWSPLPCMYRLGILCKTNSTRSEQNRKNIKI